ncbi:serine protease [Vibrio gazogenes]|uniref:Serine protease n=1 Tax=Vibrio gazogenes DSM 21264 = NBRC 103151 TaxID=1123492 RepID=A0A1M4YFD9_VIBGA|nr:trypsin-like serine protease [Vibrio gazogenes]USP14962.1 trypsin-like serine protease [Vibrio gazogenes]SHF04378.1 V8-like Glu-specific endopeptidase [Vibrio gazogenes DSM 21264] [Vibrio gazogenes DSM 21264 = NBRC 103151]SJN55866.1 Extracellular metalloprotease precursor [Vibrio gazogenes]
MKLRILSLSIIGLCSLGVQADDLTQFTEMSQKANFIDGVNVVQPPEFTNDPTFSDSIVDRADAMGAIAVDRDGNQYTAEISEDALRAFEDAVKTFDELGLDATIFTTPEKDATIKPKMTGEEEDIQGAVIGHDDRTQITRTTTSPYNYIGHISVGCTGTLIGDKYVLTAGHCVADGRGNWYRALDFAAGQNGSAKPWGTTAWKNAVTTTAWFNDRNSNYDYALIVLQKAPHGGYSGWGVYSDGTHSVTGYPGDKTHWTMWTDSGATNAISSYRVCYTLDTAGGQSGSGIRDTRNYVRGIHTTGSSSRNCGTRLTSSVYNTLKQWISSY